MGTQGNFDKSKERECPCAGSPEPCAQANGRLTNHSIDSKLSDEGNSKGAALCPFTPNPHGENGDSVFDTNTPLSLEFPQSPNMVSIDSASNDDDDDDDVVRFGIGDSPRTPVEGVFDPFAPGPEEMLLAPMCKKLIKESRTIVARRLDFDEDEVDDVDGIPAGRGPGDDAKDVEVLSEELLLDAVYGTLLEAIVMKQTEDFLAENHHPLEVEGVGTPTSPPKLTGITDTCPGAPVKAPAAGKLRNIDPGLCRKLEF